MSTTVAAIAAEAFDSVEDEISGVIKAATLTRSTQGAYNTTTGAYAVTTTEDTGRAIEDTQKALQDRFPDYVVGPKDTLFWLEGFTVTPQENDTLTIGGIDRIIVKVGDVAGAGSFFAVVAR